MDSKHFDKLLVTAIIFTFAVMAFHAYHAGERDLATLAADQIKLFSGALLTLITKELLGGRGSQTNPSNPQPDEKKI